MTIRVEKTQNNRNLAVRCRSTFAVFVHSEGSQSMTNSVHTAVGQSLGYMYQFERATYRLLEATDAVVSVAVEHLDDVSVNRADGTSIREQDKATIRSTQPLTDRSVALWKTIAIWAEAVVANPEMLRLTEFHLVTNGQVGTKTLAARIHAAKSPTEASSIATELQTTAKDLREGLQSFAARISDISHELLASLVARIFVLDNVSASFGGNLDQLQSLRLLGELQRTAVFDNAAGYVRRTVLEAAQEGRPAIINRQAFDRELKALFRRVAVAPLSVLFETEGSIVDPANYQSHGFFQQLDWIDTDVGFVRQCVIHFVQAQAARVKWTDAEAISEASLRAYEEDLKTRWQLHVMRQSSRIYPTALLQGQERLIETLSEDSSLDGQPMPKAITCGSFHALANFDAQTDPKIGWHPEFEKLAKNSKGQS